MKIAFLQTGRTSDKNISGVADLYYNRIRHYNSFEMITLPDIKNAGTMPVTDIRLKEGRKILDTAEKDDFVILLDEKGREFRTTEFAEWLGKCLMTSRKRLLFVIGGAWGFSDEVYDRADLKISLSKMTFPHQLVRLLFLEQMYRAFTILRGEQYHHE
jgi:23S rRNA (pseudouridine1915-N3)-methyltransferase